MATIIQTNELQSQKFECSIGEMGKMEQIIQGQVSLIGKYDVIIKKEKECSKEYISKSVE